ncbi:MAG: FAD-dependent monooxygenase, partial [Pseudomonadota bacterium]
DFPDIRLKCAVQSAHHGSLLIIPREGGYLVRLYIELDSLKDDERAADRDVTSEQLAQRAREILAPYRFDVKEVAWCSAYEVGQRVCDSFDDIAVSDRGERTPRVFIAGDACHTHSPKAGQGMNVSMADAFNLGWKLAAVLRGQAHSKLLDTYTAERQAKARELIDFDRDMARLFSAKARNAAEASTFQRYFQQHGRYTAGVETRYDPSLIVGDQRNQAGARGLVVGKRFHSAPVIRLTDAKPMQLSEALSADGRWRLIAFAAEADDGSAGGHIAALCTTIEQNVLPNLPAEAGADVDAMLDLRAVFQQHHRELSLQDLPALLRPQKGKLGLIDTEKVFCADRRENNDIFDKRGIARQHGALILVRPDQYIAQVLNPTDTKTLQTFFTTLTP